MKLRRPVYIRRRRAHRLPRQGHPDFVRDPTCDRRNPTLEEHLHRAIRDLLAETGADPAAIDKGYVGNFCGELFASQGHLGAIGRRRPPGPRGKPLARVEGACASGGLAVAACIDALQAPARSPSPPASRSRPPCRARSAADYIARAAHYETQGRASRQVFPRLFARRARHYKEAFGATDEDLARVVVKAYDGARRNPYAQMRAVPMGPGDSHHAHGPQPLLPRRRRVPPPQVSPTAAR